MTNKNAEVSQGDAGASLPPPQAGPPDHLRSRGSNGNTVFKSGSLFLSSKGIGWTSWKKRWFILTRTSLVFFRSDPSAVPQKGSEVNLTLGGIDLNNSGSVVIKADKKLLTVLFPDGRDGRAFTLKAETTEDLYEWKNALENALAQAPSAANVTGQNVKDIEPIKSTVIGRPILLALEDVDGSPTFLEKALKFIEEHGVKVEGILRQAADVDDVEHRVREYEQGKVEFSAEEDAHVVADCVKHVLRELPSSPVPASCCKAMLEACRTERAIRLSAIRAAICDTFPEPNRRLLQRILLMMQSVASHKAENRMSSSAVAACMAPLLLRPLLAGECEIENDFDVGGDGSVQLLQAAAAANHAQTIVITLLEEYDSIFGEGSVSPDIYTDSEESGSESEEATDDDESYDDDYDDECDESIQGSDADTDNDLVSEPCSETEDLGGKDDKDHDRTSSDLKSSGVSGVPEVKQISSNSLEDIKSSENLMSPIRNTCAEKSNAPADIVEGVSTDQSTVHNSNNPLIKKSKSISNGPVHAQSHTVLGRTSAMKNLSLETVDHPSDEAEIETLETIKAELINQIAEEAKGNANLHSYIENRKKALHDRHLALEQDVARLQEQLRKEKNSRATLEAGLKNPPGLSDLTCIDEKTKAELEELALVEADITKIQRQVDDLGVRLNLHRKQNHSSALDFCNQPQQISNHETKLKNKLDTEVAATSQSQVDKSRSKDTHVGVAENVNERKLEPTTLPNKNPPQTSSKKSGAKGESQVANFTTSTLTKLTTRLNFLKERSSQLRNEFQNVHKGPGLSAQNLFKGKGSEHQQAQPSPNKSGGSESHSVTNPDKGRELGHSPQNLLKGKGSELHQPQPSANKSQGSESRSVINPEKGRALDSSQSHQSPDKGSGKEGQSLQNSDKLKKSDSQPPHHSDRWNQQSQHHLDRGKPEGHQSYNVDKGR